MTYIIPLNELTKDDLSVAGGKGANLGEMTTADFSIPPGFVLTTRAYDAFVRANDLQPAIIAFAQTVTPDNPQSSTDAAQKIRALFLDGNMAGAMADEIRQAYQQLARDGDMAVAVRSSATAEDLPTASFAGQQETYLNVQGQEALLDAVKKCWASLWTARAIAYRQRQGIDPAAVSLAVVVQRLVPAEAAGVLFTANPVNGRRDQIVINATWGLGEAIVGGQVTPDTVVVDKTTYEILSQETATKTVMTVRTAAGTAVQPVPPARQKQIVLATETAVQLARLGARLEAHYDQPMDVEWALAGGEIAILQARPITALPAPRPAPPPDAVWEPVVPGTIWMRRQIVEHMPEPLSPLFEELYLHKGLDYAMDKLFQDMGDLGGGKFDLDAFVPHGFAGTINGYAYTTASIKMSGANLLAILRIYARVFKFLKMDSFDYDNVVLPQYQALIDQWQATDLAAADDETLLDGIRELAAADSSYWFGSALNMGFSRLTDSFFDWLLRSWLLRYQLPTPRPVSASFLRGFDSKALDAQADMEALAATMRASASLRALVTNTPAHEMQAALAAHPEGQPALDGIQRYLDKYGHQIYNLDFVAPTQNEDPLPMLLSLKALVENAPEQDVRTRQAQMATEREALVAKTMQGLNPLSRRLFRWMWKQTKQYAPYRETVMFYMGAAWPTARRLARELGQRLTDAGTLATADDIYFLDSSEIMTAVAARAKGEHVAAYKQLAQERRALRAARQQLTPPPKVPESGSLKIGPIKLSMFDPAPLDAGSDGPVLSGHAVSTGRVTAPASVIHSIEDFDQMKPGTVLVCTTTTPAWTPLFSQAVGLVTDIGGALAHGSIVAREYGIPAVMGTAVATERIQPGMLLEVDGDAGTVTLIAPG